MSSIVISIVLNRDDVLRQRGTAIWLGLVGTQFSVGNRTERVVRSFGSSMSQ